MSLHRLSQILLTLCLLGSLTYLYFLKSRTTQEIEFLKSYQIKDELFLVHTPYKFPALSLDASDKTDFVAALPYLLQQLLPSEGKLLHIGAKSGIHTLLTAQHSQLPIVALEGQPKQFTLLTKNIKLHALENRVKCRGVNAADTSSEMRVCFDAALNKDDCNKQTSEIEKEMKGTDCHTIKQKAVDALLHQTKPSFIIIESHLEAGKVIEGMKETLARSDYPPILLFPNTAFAQNNKGQWAGILRAGGYMTYKVEKSPKKKGFDITQIDIQEISRNEPCFILITKELMPIWF